MNFTYAHIAASAIDHIVRRMTPVFGVSPTPAQTWCDSTLTDPQLGRRDSERYKLCHTCLDNWKAAHRTTARATGE